MSAVAGVCDVKVGEYVEVHPTPPGDARRNVCVRGASRNLLSIAYVTSRVPPRFQSIGSANISILSGQCARRSQAKPYLRLRCDSVSIKIDDTGARFAWPLELIRSKGHRQCDHAGRAERRVTLVGAWRGLSTSRALKGGDNGPPRASVRNNMRMGCLIGRVRSVEVGEHERGMGIADGWSRDRPNIR
jgi:hypothetical protein